MPSAPRRFQPRRSQPRAEVAREVDRDRGSARARGYTPAWDRASKDHRAEHPLCGYCAIGAFGPQRDEPTTCTDHLYPQRQYEGVFWVRIYWVSSCDDCHAGPKQALERQGRPALDALARALGLSPL